MGELKKILLEGISFTLEDVKSCQIEDLIIGLDIKDALTYSGVFLKTAQQYDVEGNAIKREISLLFSCLFRQVCTIETHFNDKRHFSPIFTTEPPQPGLREYIIQDNSGIIEILEQYARSEKFTDPEFKSHLCHILFDYDRGNHELKIKDNLDLLEKAIDGYKQSSSNFELNDWQNIEIRLKKALFLARYLGLKHPLFLDMFGYIENKIFEMEGKDESFFTIKLYENLLNCTNNKLSSLGSDDKKHETLCRNAIKTCKEKLYNTGVENKIDQWGKIFRYYEILKNFVVNKDDLYEEIADNFIEKADYAIEKEEPFCYGSAASDLEKACSILNINKQKHKDKYDETYKKLVECQCKLSQYSHTYSQEIDITKFVIESRNKIHNRSFADSLTTMASEPYIRYRNIDSSYEENNKKYPLLSLFSKKLFNEDGQTLATKTNKEDIFSDYLLHQQYISLMSINPFFSQLCMEHDFDVNMILNMLHYSPFVPEGRKYLFAQGLYYGLTGRTIESVHILIPQVENSLRYILQNHGYITTLQKNGIQEEADLNDILKNNKDLSEAITKILGEDCIYELRSILIERFGSNLRNNLAHGLLSFNMIQNNPICTYFIWIVLKLCLSSFT